MQVNLVSKTQVDPSFNIDGLDLSNPEALMIWIARVSSSKQNNPKYAKLLKYCIENGHWSVFEMIDVTFEIYTSRAIAQQILRHRSFSFQEFCISGETEIYFDLPGAIAKGNRKLEKTRIDKLYQQFMSGKRKMVQKRKVRIYDENSKSYSHANIKEVMYTGKKPMYKITLADGKSLKCTENHKLLGREGFVPLKDLVGLSLDGSVASMSKDVEVAVNGISCHQDKEWLNEAKQSAIENGTGLYGIADAANVSTHTIRKWLKRHDISFTKEEVATYTPPWNKGKFGYKGKPRTSEQKEYMRDITPRGKYHHAYKGGSASKRKAIANHFNKYRSDIFESFGYTCQMCGESFGSEKIELHHIKEVALYPELALDIDNVIPVHKRCHMTYHGKTPLFKNTKFKGIGNKLVPQWEKIVQVEYIGEDDTYDLEIDHTSHNYVANGIVVHNSQRYAEVTGFEEYSARRQASNNRQSSQDTLSEDDQEWFIHAQRTVQTMATQLYQAALEKDIGRECARFLLPLGTQTRMFMKGSLRSWIHYLKVRDDEHTQLEHREIAQAIKEILKQHFPTIAEAMEW